MTKILFTKIYIFFVLIFLFNSCTNENSPLEPQYGTRGEIVSATLAKEYTPQEIKAIGYTLPLVFNIKAYKIVFRTIDGSDNEILASGVVLIPQKTDSMATVFHNHGSAFKKTDGAASELGSSINEGLLFAATGYVIFLPDYLGFGASKNMFHPYHIQKYYADSGVDFYRAAKKFCADNSIKLNGKNFLMGYSEGGYAVLALQKEIEKNYSSEFKLTGVAAAAGAYSMTETSKFLIGSQTLTYPAYVAYVYWAYKTYYNLTYQNNQIFKEPYATQIPILFDGTKSGSEINNALTYTTADLLTPEFISSFLGSGYQDVKSYFSENNLIDWKPITQLRLFHGAKDITVPYINSEVAYNSFKSKGSNVTLITSTAGTQDHAGSAVYWFYDTLGWFGTF